MVKSMEIASYGDEPMREGGLQARVRVKRSLTQGSIRVSRFLAVATYLSLDLYPRFNLILNRFRLNLC